MALPAAAVGWLLARCLRCLRLRFEQAPRLPDRLHGSCWSGPHRHPPVVAPQAFLDSTGGLWQAGALVGKPAGVFVSVGTQVREGSSSGAVVGPGLGRGLNHYL